MNPPAPMWFRPPYIRPCVSPTPPHSTNMENMATQSLNKEFGEQKVYVSESFVVDMEHISHHLVEKEINANSRITLQRNHSRKNSLKKQNFNDVNEKDTNLMAISPKGASMPEKSTVVTSDHSTPHVHNQNTSVVAASSGAATTTTIDGKVAVSKRFSFRRSSSSSPWTIDPRRILIFFATLSSMGTILLIYFTLSLTKLNGEDKASY
ncbi:hypothetical protein R3W88_026065 [Solanum pinnatisectum]|uniref:Transmembrane protein n=1 Tax=Solanum pinnatisectum TaxID=50273 RepID=A0AAV9LCE2_9SOLN|nr:hypothetical protein R3W88_026065 [Solanum pinnatisectum]